MTPKKFILASSAKWFEMLIIILVNIFSVPIILSKWGPETFGAWILLQGVMAYVNLPNIAFQEYIHNKNLKLGFKKKKKNLYQYNFGSTNNNFYIIINYIVFNFRTKFSIFNKQLKYSKQCKK